MSHEAARYWRRTLAAAPARTFDPPAAAGERPRYWMVRLVSPALRAGAHLTAMRLQVSTSLVYLTAFSTLIMAYTGRDAVLLKLVSSNRTPELRDMIGAVVQDGLFLARRPGSTFTEAVRRLWGAAALAYRHARYDPEEIAEVVREANALRGGEIDLSNCFNDRRREPETDSRLAGMGREELHALLPYSRIETVGSWAKQDPTVFAHVDDDGAAGHLSLLTDTWVVPRGDIDVLLRGMETVIVRAAFDDVPLAEFKSML